MPAPAWQPFFMKDLIAWIKNPSIPMYGRWNHPPPAGNPNAPGEGGVDLTSPPGTPIFALADGPVVGAGYWNDLGHGVISQRVNVPGRGLQDIYYQHIILNPGIAKCTGGGCSQMLHKGQLIGVTGGFGEVELGFNPGWGGIWAGGSHPAGTRWESDPRPMLAALLSGSSVPGTVGTVSPGAPGATGSSAAPAAVDLLPANWLPQLRQEAIKISLFVLALVLFGFGAYLLFQKQVEEAAGDGLKTAMKVPLV